MGSFLVCGILLFWFSIHPASACNLFPDDKKIFLPAGWDSLPDSFPDSPNCLPPSHNTLTLPPKIGKAIIQPKYQSKQSVSFIISSDRSSLRYVVLLPTAYPAGTHFSDFHPGHWIFLWLFQWHLGDILETFSFTSITSIPCFFNVFYFFYFFNVFNFFYFYFFFFAVLKGGYRSFFHSFTGSVGHNIWWENSRNGSFGSRKGPKIQK